MAEAQRGTPFLYPLCDASGDCVIVESGKYTNESGAQFNPLQYVTDAKVSLNVKVCENSRPDYNVTVVLAKSPASQSIVYPKSQFGCSL